MTKETNYVKFKIERAVRKSFRTIKRYPTIYNYNFKHVGVLYVPLDVNNEKKLAKLLYDKYGSGRYIGQGWIKKKCKDGKTRVCFKKKKSFDIKVSGRDGILINYVVYEIRGMSHYRFFWKNR